MDWTGKVALVTGASSGIGAALAQALSRRGAWVALAARRADRLQSVAQACPRETLLCPGDLTDPSYRGDLVRRTVAWKGRLDVLVNNAGLGIYRSLEETRESELRQVWEVNFLAPCALIQAVVPVMKSQKAGWIVNIASTGGLVAHTAHVAPYLAAKHALVGLSRGLRKDVDGTGIQIQVVCPHLTRTEFFASCIGAEGFDGWIEDLYEKMDTAEEVAEGIVSKLGSGEFIVFPTDRARRAYERFKDLCTLEERTCANRPS